MRYVSVNKYIGYMEKYHLSWKRHYRRKGKTYNSNDCKNIEIFKKWCKKYAITEYMENGINSWIKLNDKNKYKISDQRTPLEDHVDMFRTINKEIIFITQPYSSLKIMNDVDINKWCTERGLSYTVSQELSWHYPGETILIQYTLKDRNIFDNYIKKLEVVA